MGVIEVAWKPPNYDYIKVNSDGPTKSKSNRAWCGGVIKGMFRRLLYDVTPL